ncbi:LysM peptidoglycan-binding domain-containing protein [Proteinivorax hydrogeniformans]|uniref:LysM peptidoglycan-binding domain-containing protein n=1 Tax=Proteinivorax hydrogeniformans TaxID=1826727 RepID=A0AAU8HT56_9FIRM
MSTRGRVPSQCPPNFQGRYTVQSGDTMFFIAKRFGVSLQALINANPHISNPNLIYPGDVLCVPGPPKPPKPPKPRVPKKCPPGFRGRYTVQPSDTMFLIAQRFGVSLHALIDANPHITNPDLIFPGDVLCVPKEEPELTFPCSVTLDRTREARRFDIWGAVILNALNDFAVTFVGVNLPDPGRFGRYDSYIGIHRLARPRREFRVELELVTNDLDTWVGTRTVPKATPDDTLEIRPYNSRRDEVGPVILRGRIADCCN